jgi:Ca-activated chloride channel homolog
VSRGVIATLVALAGFAAFAPGTASAWDLLRAPNPHVERGNAHMRAGAVSDALEAYDKAARELPSEGGVHLNRGLALMAADEVAKAHDALLLATEPPADASVRADAYYNLGLLYYHRGDAAAASESHAEAQEQFRSAVEAFKRSLRARPGNRDAGWNLELALRRLQEEQEKEREQQERQQEEQKQDDQQQDDQQQDDQQQDDQQQDDQQQDDQQQDDRQQDDQQQDDQQQQDQQQEPPPQPEDRPLPREAERVLDALEGSEDNLWRHRARERGMQQRRRPAKDW